MQTAELGKTGAAHPPVYVRPDSSTLAALDPDASVDIAVEADTEGSDYDDDLDEVMNVSDHTLKCNT